MVLDEVKKILKKFLIKYDLKLEEGKQLNIFISRSDLEKITKIDPSVLEERHNLSPTIKEFINFKEQLFYDGWIEIRDNKIELDIESVYIPLELENRKFNKILDEIGYNVDSIEKVNENYKDYLYLWWD